MNDLNYADTIRRGYLQVTVTNAEVKGEYVFVDNVKNSSYSAVVGKTVTVTAAGATSYA